MPAAALFLLAAPFTAEPVVVTGLIMAVLVAISAAMAARHRPVDQSRPG